jgi:hypothetical protein
MMLNDASCGRAHYGVMTGNVTHHAANRRTFQAAFCAGNSWRHRQSCGSNESNKEFVHFSHLLRFGLEP